MKKTKTVCKSLWLLFTVILLAGCWDREELEDKAYVIGLGLDHSKTEDRIKVTMLIENPEVGGMQGGGGSSEKPREIISFDANDFLSAKSTANVVISRKISYDLLKIIVVSEELAKDQRFVTWIYDALRDREIRLDAYLAVSKEKPSDYFKHNHPRMETRPHKYFEFMIEHGISNGLIPDSTLFRYFKTTDRGTDLFLAMYTTAKKEKNPEVKNEDEYLAGQLDATGDIDKTQFIGSAVFKNGVMINKLNGQETRIVNILDDTTEVKALLASYKDPFSDNRMVAVRIMKTENNRIKMNLKGPKPKIQITLPLKFDILTNPSITDYANSKKNRDTFKKSMIDQTESLFEGVLKKTQTELKGAPYPLPTHAQKYFGTIEEFNKFNWVKSYPEADITVKADIQIIDYGKQSNILKGKGKAS
jgi:Ger(x)C family germination protein